VQANVDRFEQLILPHLDDAYALARYLLRNEHDAQDATHDAVLRALRYFDGFRDGDPRAWLLTIVRNCCFSHGRRNRHERVTVPFEEEHMEIAHESRPTDATVIEESERESVNRLVAALPIAYREVVVCRELHEMSYAQISEVVGVPIGTVMSRLSRARRLLAAQLAVETRKGELR
jgi:RNA polymerase sigma-70 factor, ECF subfamily